MEIKKSVWFILLFLLCVVLYQCVGRKSAAPPQNTAQTSGSDNIDYSVVVPPEQLPQFKDTVIYQQSVPEKDPLWMNPPDTDLMPPKDSNDPHNGIL